MGHLTLLLLVPLLGALATLLAPVGAATVHRRIALTATLAGGVLALILAAGFEPTGGPQFQEQITWSARLGTDYALAVDGLSLPLVLLATLLCLVAVLASGAIHERTRSYYALLLILESALLGVFLARDWALFYLFWELTLIPLFFLIDRWGGPQRHRAALNFVLYTLGGSVFLLIALLALFDAAPDAGFAMSGLAATARGLPEQTQILLLLAFLAGFGVKMPVFPLHGWLPLAHVQAPAPISILLSGILLKLGSYGLLRAAAMLPDAARALQDPLLALALIGLLYGGLLAWRQTDLKAMVAYSSISHMGVVLLGIATLDATGLTGAVTQMVAHGLVAASLFLLFGLLYQRTHSRDLGHYGSLLAVAPRFTVFLVLAFVAAVGLPGSAGFVAELHTLIGGFLTWGWWVLGLAAGMLISAAYALRCVGWLCTGPLRGSLRGLPDLARGELLAAALLAVGTFWLGWFPGPLLGLTGPTLTQLAAGFGGG